MFRVEKWEFLYCREKEYRIVIAWERNLISFFPGLCPGKKIRFLSHAIYCFIACSHCRNPPLRPPFCLKLITHTVQEQIHLQFCNIFSTGEITHEHVIKNSYCMGKKPDKFLSRALPGKENQVSFPRDIPFYYMFTVS